MLGRQGGQALRGKCSAQGAGDRQGNWSSTLAARHQVHPVSNTFRLSKDRYCKDGSLKRSC
jgi:hypothetical protein